MVSCSVTRGGYAGGLRGSVSRGRGIASGQAINGFFSVAYSCRSSAFSAAWSDGVL